MKDYEDQRSLDITEAGRFHQLVIDTRCKISGILFDIEISNNTIINNSMNIIITVEVHVCAYVYFECNCHLN